ncbi:MAG: ABC transporter permease [Candidatus Aminicenantes bacterium]|nr:ABC transporter permease [Candidatus Aminicenantes bacterium]
MIASEKRFPKLALKILRRTLPRNDAYYLLDNIVEIYEELSSTRGLLYARLWVWWQVFTGLPHYIRHHTYWSFQMIRNYIVSTFRFLRKDKLHSFIKITGLAIGLACVILIFLFVRYELSYDTFNRKQDRIYRVVLDNVHDDGIFPMAPTMLPLAPALRRDFPEVEKATRISCRSSQLLSSGEHRFYESLHFADAEVFSIFDLPFKQGNPDTALLRPFCIVLTEDTAEKYFGRSDPLGKVLRLNENKDFTVTGVLKKIPENFHLRIKMLVSFESLKSQEKDRWVSWDRFSNDYTYILLTSGMNPVELEKKLPEFQETYAGSEIAEKQKLRLQSLRDIHFSSLNYDDAVTYERGYLYALSAVALFIMVLAYMNFINLATVRSAGRALEVGMRKVVGARRSQLVLQFLTESFLLSMAAIAAAVGLVYLVLSRFCSFLNRQIAFDLSKEPMLVLMLLVLFLITGFSAGIYPAIFLSASKPVHALRQKLTQGSRRLSFRMVFVVLQFTVSIVLIIATLVVYQQLGFMMSKDLGFFSDQIVVIPLQDSPLRQNAEPFKIALLHYPGILGVTCASGTPGSGSSNASNFVLETPEGEKEVYIQTIVTDAHFVSTFGLNILEGRDFSQERGSDREESYILNQTAARKMGWDSPIGKRITRGGGKPGLVIGVVEDFFYDSLHSQISPIALNIRPSRIAYAAVRMRPEETSNVLSFIEETWERIAPLYPFEYFFTEERFFRYYRFEAKMGEMFTAFALLAIIISCLGVFGLISYTAEQSTKEIGVRKVLGANISGIVILLSKRFVRWVAAANLMAWPLAWFAMHKWLEGFAYRVSINPLFFPLAGILTLFITLAVLSYKSLKAACANPVDSLRYE